VKPGRLRAWLAASAIFVLGAIAGGAGVGVFGLMQLRETLRAPDAASMHLAQRAMTRLTDRLVADLALTPDEASQVRAILTHAATRITGARDRFSRETRAEVRAALLEVAVALPPEKRTEFRRVVAERFAKLGLPAPILQPPDTSPAPNSPPPS